MLTRRRKWLLGMALGLLLTAASLFAWLVLTESGLAFAVRTLGKLGTVELEIEGAQGRLAGPLSATRIVIRHPRAEIVLEDLVADYEPSELLAGRIAAEGLRLRRASVQLRPRTTEATPPAFMPRWLSADLGELAIDELEITTASGSQQRLRELRGSAHINRSRIRFRDLAVDGGSWSVSHAAGRVLAGEPLGIEATARWTAMAGGKLQGELRAAGNLALLEATARVSAPGIATARVTLNDLAGALRWQAEVALESLDLEQWLPAGAPGPLTGQFTAGGGISEYGARGTVLGAGLPVDGLMLNTHARYESGVVKLDPLTLSHAASQLRFASQVQLDMRAATTLRATAEWQQLRWPLTGRADLRSAAGRLQLEGWEDFRWELVARASVPGLPAVDGKANGLLTAEQLIIESSDLSLLRGRVLANGMLGRSSPLAWSINAEAHALDPAALHRDLPGRLSFSLAASGYGVDADAAWAGAITDLRGRFRGQPAAGRGLLRHHPGNTQFEQVDLALGSARLALNGTVGEVQRLDAQLQRAKLGDFLPGLAGDLQGQLTLRGAEAEVSLTGRDLAWGHHRAGVLSLDAKLDLDDAQPSWARLRSSSVMVAGQRLANARLSLDGHLREHRLELRSGAGGQAVDLLGQGSWRDGDYTLLAEELVARNDDVAPWQLDAPVRLRASRQSAALERACFRDGPRRVCAEANWQRNRGWSVSAATEAFPLEALSINVPGRPHYRGLLSAEARISGAPGHAWVANATAEIRGAMLAYRTPSGREQSIALGRTLMGLQTDASQHQFTLSLVDASAAELSAEVTAQRDDVRPWRELALSGHLRGATRQLDLLPLLMPDIDRAAGSLRMDLAIAGTLARPLLQGQMQLQGGSLDFYQANLRLRDIAAQLRLQDGDLGLDASARIGEGQLTLAGNMDWRGEALAGELTLRGDRLLLVNVPEARITASPDLRFRLHGKRILVTGTVQVPRATIDPADTAGAVLPSADEQLVGVEATERLASGIEVESDVTLLLGDQVRLNAYGLSGRITGSLRTRSRPGELAVGTGELEIAEGRYRAYTRELEIERGKLLFAGGAVADPGVDLRASRALPSHKVGVQVRGRLRHPQISLYSEPALPQTQIASLLIVGQSLDSLQDTDAGSLEAQRANLVAQGGALVAGQLGRYVGLDEVGVSQDSADNTSLVLGKFLSPTLYVSYGISLVDEINTIKLRYTIGKQWAIRLESGREASADVEYQIER